MKEATGELNMTVVTVVAIAAVAAFFYAFIWPGIKNTIKANTYCAMATCNADRSECTYVDENVDLDTVDCSKYDYNTDASNGQ